MKRVVLALALCGSVATASAGTAPWSVTLPDGWRDTTAATASQPRVVEAKRLGEARGQHLEMAAYADEAGNELVLSYTSVNGGAPERSAIETMLTMGRERMTELGPEASYEVLWNPRVVISTQRVRAATPMTVKLYVGFGMSGSLLAVHARCSGDARACDGALAGVAIDQTRFHPLDSLDDIDAKPVSRRGELLGGLSMIALLAGITLRQRHKARQKQR